MLRDSFHVVKSFEDIAFNLSLHSSIDFLSPVALFHLWVDLASHAVEAADATEALVARYRSHAVIPFALWYADV